MSDASIWRRGRVLALAGLLAAGGAALTWLQRPPGAPAPAGWAVLADDGGEILHVACVANSARQPTLPNAPLVTSIVNALPERTGVTILTNDLGAFVLEGAPYSDRVFPLELPEEFVLTIWPQDPFVVLVGPAGESVLLAGRGFARADDRVLAEDLAAHLGWDYRLSELAFEGGNVVVGRRHVFIGVDTIRLNAAATGLSDSQVVARFREEFGRCVAVLGASPQAVPHLDMIVTPLDGRNVAVADAGRGSAIARRQLRDDAPQVLAFEQSCQRNLQAALGMLPAGEDEQPAAPTLVGATSSVAEESRRIARDLDDIAGQLRALGYAVHRVPFLFPGVGLPGAQESAAAGATTAPAGVLAPGYPWLTYNNVLIENLARERIVYLPQYGWEAMDRAARRAWEAIGYRVVPVTGLTASAIHGGSLRCCVKVLRRE